ncbi:ATP-binding cassette domain-containing protein [Shinella pollutisoli]|uniref:ATP-binding cassette domain-containing protein n=1 Tax=Shinella pollutisoli TaxID=2250594 RepID=A0ABV7DGR5_9HYPH|nr:amino acid ABC transporter ATP-binding protein [Shinella pollutisoli]
MVMDGCCLAADDETTGPDPVRIDRKATAGDRDPGAAADRETIIEADNLEKWFGAHKVLDGVSLEANRGDVIAIVGSSGSGKSTLLRCMNLLETPDAGSLRFRGEQIAFDGAPHERARRKQVERLRSQVGMVFQAFNLWDHRTVLENLMEGPRFVLGLSRREAADRARAYLAKVGLSGKENAYPAHLSGGQQQRVAIARALAMAPHAILFDEPTSALDPELVGEVLRVMRQLAAEGTTMVIVTHEMAFARDVASRLVFLQGGRVAAQGAPRDLFGGGAPQRLRDFLSGGGERAP